MTAVQYFGPPIFKQPDEVQIPPPVGEVCILCEEPVDAGDIGTINLLAQVTHYECQMREIIGSVGHLKRTCSCYGGTEGDPPAMTRRQAAKAAVAFYNSRSITCPRCGRTSHHPGDVAQGFCGNCHDWTSAGFIPPAQPGRAE
jgi:hypothetical protein